MSRHGKQGRYGKTQMERYFEAMQGYCAARAKKTDDNEQEPQTASIDSQPDPKVESTVIKLMDGLVRDVKKKHPGTSTKTVHLHVLHHLGKKMDFP